MKPIEIGHLEVHFMHLLLLLHSRNVMSNVYLLLGGISWSHFDCAKRFETPFD